MIVDLCKAITDDCRGIKSQSMIRGRHGIVCPSRVCSLIGLYEVWRMTDAYSLDAVGIRLIPLWIAQSLLEPFLELGTRKSDSPDKHELSRSTRHLRAKFEVHWPVNFLHL